MTITYDPAHAIPRPARWEVLYRSSGPFWDGVAAGKLLLQRCTSCGRWLTPPRPMCPGCQSRDHEWVPASGHGTVHSFVTYRRSPNPAFAAPYTVVLVELEEGPRIISNVVGITPEDVAIGMAVDVVFANVADDFTLFQFRPAGQ
jgi:uncharacterized OB-fold protein